MSVYMLDCNRGHFATEHVRTCFRPADVRDTSSLVAAFREEGVGEVVRIGMTLYGTNFIDDQGQREPGKYLVVRIDGEET